MTRSLIAALATVISGYAIAQDGTPPTSDEPTAVKLTKEELVAFLPGTGVRYLTRSGSLQRWTNELSSKFVARTDNKSTTPPAYMMPPPMAPRKSTMMENTASISTGNVRRKTGALSFLRRPTAPIT